MYDSNIEYFDSANIMPDNGFLPTVMIDTFLDMTNFHGERMDIIRFHPAYSDSALYRLNDVQHAHWEMFWKSARLNMCYRRFAKEAYNAS